GIGDSSSDNELWDNVIFGNWSYGVHIVGGGGNLLYRNSIGVTVDGEERYGSSVYGESGFPSMRNGGHGIGIEWSNGNEIGIANGLANVIAFNAGAGVRIQLGIHNRVFANRIQGNGGLGIELVGAGANNAQAAPDLDAATRSFQKMA